MPLSRTIPAMPVQDIVDATRFYSERLGYGVRHAARDFAIVTRDDAVIHLWSADDDSWRDRTLCDGHPVQSGAESFIAGTASCRVEVDTVLEVDDLYAQMKSAEVLHPGDEGSPIDTAWGTREFALLDLEGNLLTYFTRRPTSGD